MKNCGTCTLCCEILDVPGMAPEWVKCKHETKCNGCSFYKNRPQVCKSFNCLWLESDVLGADLRPDKCGVVFQLYETDKTVVAVDNGIWNKGGNTRLLISQMLKDGYVVWLVTRENKHLLLPQGITEKEARIRTASAWRHIYGNANVH